MHMADALISPQVGGTFWLLSAGLITYCARKIKKYLQSSLIPLMGVLGAFVFAGQMINFTIPTTGSSGHIGGGLLLAILLGPHAAFLAIASVLTIQALFFADGGLLALGCNIFNLGFFPAFIAYPFIYKKIIKDNASSPTKTIVASVTASTVGLVMGALAVTIETKLSGITSLPFGTFAALMVPIHIAIGIVEGAATGMVVTILAKTRPEILSAPINIGTEKIQLQNEYIPGIKPVIFAFLLATLLIGGVASWFASTHPDGLEWSVSKIIGKEEPPPYESSLHQKSAMIQEKISFMPDYNFKSSDTEEETDEKTTKWPIVNKGTSLAGIIGSVLTLGLVSFAGFILKKTIKNELNA